MNDIYTGVVGEKYSFISRYVGGMCIIDRAMDKETGLVVSLRRLKRDSYIGRRQLLNGAEISSHFNGKGKFPNYIETYFGDNNSVENISPVVVYEWISGTDLFTTLAYGPEINPDTQKQFRFRVLHHLCHSVETMHQEGYIHADIKPGNLICDEQGNSVLIDFDGSFKGKVKQSFGIEYLTFDYPNESDVFSSTRDGTRSYTLQYCPPEVQSSIPNLSEYMDIWGIGCVAYMLLTGRRIVDPSHFMMLSSKQRTKSLNEVHKTMSFVSEIPPNLRDMLIACFQPQMHNRPKAKDLKEIIDEHTKKEGIELDTD